MGSMDSYPKLFQDLRHPNLPWWRLSNRWPLESFHQPAGKQENPTAWPPENDPTKKLLPFFLRGNKETAWKMSLPNKHGLTASFWEVLKWNLCICVYCSYVCVYIYISIFMIIHFWFWYLFLTPFPLSELVLQVSIFDSLRVHLCCSFFELPCHHSLFNEPWRAQLSGFTGTSDQIHGLLTDIARVWCMQWWNKTLPQLLHGFCRTLYGFLQTSCLGAMWICLYDSGEIIQHHAGHT